MVEKKKKKKEEEEEEVVVSKRGGVLTLARSLNHSSVKEVKTSRVTFSMRNEVSSTYSSPLADPAAARTSARRAGATARDGEHL